MDNRLLDKLGNLGAAQDAALGLRSVANADQTPELLMVGMADSAADATPDVYDALLVNSPADGPPEAGAGGRKPIWGCFAGSGKGAAQEAEDAKADFVLVRGDAPGNLMGLRSIVCGYWLPSEVSRQRAKSIEEANFAFLAFSAEEDVNTMGVEEALEWGDTLAQFTHHIFLSIGTLPQMPAIRMLRNLQVSGLLINDKQHKAGELAALRQEILKLEPRNERSPLRLS